MLKIVDQVPDGLLDCSATDAFSVVGGPTLIHLSGRREQPLFVSAMLHGNEPTGFYAVQQLLRKYQNEELPRALSIFIGNVEAASEGMRHLDNQPDYNRVWPYNGSPADTEEHKMMQQIIDEMRARDVFASIDVHNNTGLNPHYGCVNKLDHRYLYLATLFSRTVVYFTRPKGVQSGAFAELCPAVTVECGKPEHQFGVEHALEFLDTALHLSEFPTHDVSPQDISVYHTVATVYVDNEINIGFGNEPADVNFREDLDYLNFNELPVSTCIGKINPDYHSQAIRVINEQGEEKNDRYFTFDSGEIRTSMPIMPSMFTLDKKVIHQDCLGYLMERISIDYNQPSNK